MYMYLKSNYMYVQWIETVETCLMSRIKFQDTDLLTHASTLLATNGGSVLNHRHLDTMHWMLSVKGLIFHSRLLVLTAQPPQFMRNGMTCFSTAKDILTLSKKIT